MYIAAREWQDVEEQRPTIELQHEDERYDKEEVRESYWIGNVHFVNNKEHKEEL